MLTRPAQKMGTKATSLQFFEPCVCKFCAQTPRRDVSLLYVICSFNPVEKLRDVVRRRGRGTFIKFDMILRISLVNQVVNGGLFDLFQVGPYPGDTYHQ